MVRTTELESQTCTADSNTGMLCPHSEHLLIPRVRAMLVQHHIQPLKPVRSALFSPQISLLLVPYKVRLLRAGVCSPVPIIHAKRTRALHCLTNWLLLISRNAVKVPCKVHGFGICFCCRRSLPVQNANDPMIKAYFDPSSRSGNLEEWVRKLQWPDLRDRNARVETQVRKQNLQNLWSRWRSRIKIKVVPTQQINLHQGWLWFWIHRNNHRMAYMGGDLKDHLVPAPCHGQGCQPLGCSCLLNCVSWVMSWKTCIFWFSFFLTLVDFRTTVWITSHWESWTCCTELFIWEYTWWVLLLRMVYYVRVQITKLITTCLR